MPEQTRNKIRPVKLDGMTCGAQNEGMDETAEPEITSKPAPPESARTLYEHWCEHPGCKKWGAFGFAMAKEEPHWFCRDHRPAAKID